jgi:WD40 repeat protein
VQVTPTIPPDSSPTMPVATISAAQTLDAASTATVAPLETLDAASDSACGSARVYSDPSLSPNQHWIAIVCEPDPQKSDTYTKIFRADGTIVWEIPFYETYGHSIGFHDGAMGLYHWSNDGQFAYLTPHFCCADEPENIFFNGYMTANGLYRLDLGSGKLTTTLPPVTGDVFAGYAFSFSPNDKYLAYVSPEKLNEIRVYELKTGHIEKISLEKYDFCGKFVWAPDGKTLAFVAYRNTSQDKGIYAYYWMSVFDWLPNKVTENQATRWEETCCLRWTQEGNLMIGDDLLFDFSKKSLVVLPSPTP